MSLSLKVMINQEKTKVLFAEANSDFINVLLSFLTIPLGKLVTVLQKHNESAAIGSLTTLYKGLSELDSAHFSTLGAKEMLLNPRSSFRAECRKLGLMLLASGCCNTSSVKTETQGAEMKSLSLGFHEILELLKLSLTSATPLTDMILQKNTVENIQSGIRFNHIHQADAATESNKIVLRAFLHKSTNKFLFAEASDELVELLLSFLTLPLGGVVFLLGSNAPFKCINNLYRSVYGIDDMYFSTSETKNRLINPKLPHGYLFKNQQLLPLSEEDLIKPKTTSADGGIKPNLKEPKTER
ncbi:hypothetical protein SASPL_121789 [Salvia splendens]|uniref:Uncharacterized protein n=1 Tax=Salvia splendens TaxID=180675 RepID=A0A8X8ZV26_SALSN|nr:hypothetical protein SASPL_121789 [Salvia splendens]